MRRALAIVSLGAALLAVPLAAQMRGPVPLRPPRGFAGFGNPGFFPGLGNNPHFGFLFDGNSFFFGHRRDHFGRGFGAASDYCPMYGAYPYLMGVQSTPSSYYPDEYYEQGALRRDVDTLTGKTGTNEYANAQLPVPPQTRVAPQLATVLVFSDRHIQEVRDYAIVGRTLWILDEDQATKVPLTDLDLEGTIQLNQERGVAFTIPQ